MRCFEAVTADRRGGNAQIGTATVKERRQRTGKWTRIAQTARTTKLPILTHFREQPKTLRYSMLACRKQTKFHGFGHRDLVRYSGLPKHCEKNPCNHVEKERSRYLATLVFWHSQPLLPPLPFGTWTPLRPAGRLRERTGVMPSPTCKTPWRPPRLVMKCAWPTGSIVRTTAPARRPVIVWLHSS